MAAAVVVHMYTPLQQVHGLCGVMTSLQSPTVLMAGT